MQNKLFYNLNTVNSDFTEFQKKQALLVDHKGVLIWTGPQSVALKKFKTTPTVDLKNKNILPAFVECHTHTVFAGSRSDEFELRNSGISYLEIAKKGGGILSTMKKTREASHNLLLQSAKQRVDRFVNQGVATLEIKSGYALDLKNEIKMLEVIQEIESLYPKKTAPKIVSTFLGAHARPPEFASYSGYLNFLVDKVLPVIKKKKLSQRVDIFIEKNFFEVQDAEHFLEKALKLGFHLTIHANQLSFSGGAELALKLNSKSADHVIHLDDKAINQFAKSNTVAVLLPAADLYMKCAYPPARKLIDAGACVALATDFNPGSCPTQDLSLVGLLARLEMKMSLPEVFKGYTINAARALGLEHEVGSVEVTKQASFISTEAALSDFFYSAGAMPEHDLFIRGNKLSKAIKTSK